MNLIQKIKTVLPINAFLIAVATGTISLISIITNVHFYIPGTNALSDAREIFNSLGAAISGPIGGIIIGTISCLISPTDELRYYIIFQHWMSAVWIGWAYKKLVYEKTGMPHLAWAWILLIFVYYIPSYIPVYIITYFFFPNVYISFVGGSFPPIEALLKLYYGWIPEIIFTTVYTTLIIIALPEAYRKPLWGKTVTIKYSQLKSGVFRNFWRKKFNRNYLAIRLSLWFIILFTIPLTFLGVFTRNYFEEYFLKAEAVQQQESIERVQRMASLAGKEISRIHQIIDEMNKTGTRIIIIINKDFEISYGPSKLSGLSPYFPLFTNDLKKLILSRTKGYYIDEQNGSAVAFQKINFEDKYIISFSPPGKYKNDLSDFANLITKNLGITLLVISLLSGIIIWLLIGRPLKRLTLVTEQIGSGNYDVNATFSEMTDEVLVLGNAIDDMKHNIKSSQNKLEESELKFRTLFETANDAIVIIDREKIIDFNSKTSEFLQLEENEIRHKSILNFSPLVQSDGSYSLETIKEKIAQALNGNPQFFEWDMLRPNGIVFETEISLNRIEIKNDSYVQAIFRDISDRKKNEKELVKAKEAAEKSDQLKSEFLAQVSHEIRTPLHLILSNLAMIKEVHGENILPSLKKYLDNTKLASNRMTRTIESIINMAELQVGVYQPKYSSFDIVKDILDDLHKEFSILAELKHLDLELIVNTENCIARCDKNSLINIFSNIIDNAIKFTDSGNVSIKVEEVNSNFIGVRISDTGVGISKEYLPKLFEIFSQEESGIARSFEGNGLGLAITKRYCDTNSIDIHFESVKGKGTTVTLLIPTPSK